MSEAFGDVFFDVSEISQPMLTRRQSLDDHYSGSSWLDRIYVNMAAAELIDPVLRPTTLGSLPTRALTATTCLCSHSCVCRGRHKQNRRLRDGSRTTHFSQTPRAISSRISWRPMAMEDQARVVVHALQRAGPRVRHRAEPLGATTTSERSHWGLYMQ